MTGLDQPTDKKAAARDEFNQSVKDQGVIGEVFDFMKNNLGTSSQGRSVYNPLSLFSNVLDYDSGSRATAQRIDQATDGQQALQAVQNYKSSQDNGREFLQDSAVMAASLFAARIPGGIGTRMVASAIGGGIAKPIMRCVDSENWSMSDVAAGGVIGVSGMAGNLAGKGITSAAFRVGSFVSPLVSETTMGLLGDGVLAGAASKIGTGFALAGDFGAKQLGVMTEGTVGSAMFGASATYANERNKGTGFGDSLAAAGNASIDAAKFGFLAAGILGAPLQVRSTFRTLPEAPVRNGVASPRFAQNPRQVGQQLTQALDNVSAPGRNTVIAYHEDLDKVLNTQGIPGLHTVKVERIDKYPSSLEGGGLTDGEWLSTTFVNLNRSNALRLSAHELTHHEQNALRIWKAADDLGIGRSASQANAETIYKHLKQSDDFAYTEPIKKVLAFRAAIQGDINLPPAQVNRVLGLQAAANQYRYPGGSFNPNRLLYRWHPSEREASRVENKVVAAMGNYDSSMIPLVRLPAGTRIDDPDRR